MIKETRILYQPSDFNALIVRCNDCQGELRFSLKNLIEIPEKCAYCQEPLKMQNSLSRAEELHNLMRRLAKQERKTNYTVQMETLEDGQQKKPESIDGGF